RADHLKAHLRIDFYHAGLSVIRVQQVEGRGGFERQRLGNPACKSYSCAGWKTALRFKLIGPSSKRSEWLFHKGVASHCDARMFAAHFEVDQSCCGRADGMAAGDVYCKRSLREVWTN